MTADKTIFGLRFHANERLQPSIDGLRTFLDSPKKEGKGTLHCDDLAVYRDLLEAVGSLDHGHQTSVRDRMLYTALDHSHLVEPGLKSAVEQYKYHMHTLSEINLKKPTAFIKSAEEEIARLDPKQKDKAARKERLLRMVEERKQSLDALKNNWLAVAEELSHIITYVRDNLTKIQNLSEESIAILKDARISRTKEGDLIEDIKKQFKERLRESLHQGTITREHLEAAKEEVAGLSKRTADLVRADVYALTSLYEVIHEYSRRASRDLDIMLSEIGRKKHTSFDTDLELYARVEKILVSLIRGCRFEITVADIGTETEQDRILAEKRKEMLDHLFDLLRKGALS